MFHLGFLFLTYLVSGQNTPADNVNIANPDQCYYMAQGAINDGAGSLYVGAQTANASPGDQVTTCASSASAVASGGTPDANTCEVAIQGFYMCKATVTAPSDCQQVTITIDSGSWSSTGIDVTNSVDGTDSNGVAYSLTRQSSGGSSTIGTTNWASNGMVGAANSVTYPGGSANTIPPVNTLGNLNMPVQFGYANSQANIYNINYNTNTNLSGYMSQWMQFGGFQGEEAGGQLNTQYQAGYTTLGLGITRTCGSDITATTGTISENPSVVSGNMIAGTLKTTIKNQMQWASSAPTIPTSVPADGVNVPLQNVDSKYMVWYPSADNKKVTTELQVADFSSSGAQSVFNDMIANQFGLLSVDPDVCQAGTDPSAPCAQTSGAMSVSVFGMVAVVFFFV